MNKFELCVLHYDQKSFNYKMIIIERLHNLVSSEVLQLGTIHLRRRQNFHDFWPLPLYCRQFFSTIHRQIWKIFDPSPPKTCRRPKWMVPNDTEKHTVWTMKDILGNLILFWKSIPFYKFWRQNNKTMQVSQKILKF